MNSKNSLWSGLLLIILMLCLPGGPAHARYVGANYPPEECPCCGDNKNRVSCTACSSVNKPCSTSPSQGNLCQTESLVSTKSGAGFNLQFSLTYSSSNADYSRAFLDIGMGYGWTHSYSTLLFTQRGSMFRLDSDGTVTRYQRGGGNTYIPTRGYFETLVSNPDGTFTLRQKDETTYQFAKITGDTLSINGPVWRLTSVIDKDSNSLTLTYSGGSLTSVTDTYGRVLTLTYNNQGHLQSVKDPINRISTLQYDTTGRRLIKLTDPTGHSINYTYNTLNQITSKKDKDNRLTNFLYGNGKPIGAVDGDNARMFSFSNPVNWATDEMVLAQTQMREYVPSTTFEVDGRGNTWQYEYDKYGHITKIIAPDSTKTIFTYDPKTLRLASRTDANNNTTYFEYDNQGNLIKETDALGHVTLYEYEYTFNNVIKITYPGGSITQYDYDSRGNRIREIRDVGGLNLVREWTYDEHGNILTEKDPNGHITSYEYNDGYGHRTKVIDPSGNITRYEYDIMGNLIRMIDGNNHETIYGPYDALNRLLREVDPMGFIKEYSYDGEGNRTEVRRQVTASTWEVTRYEYDVRGRLIREIRDPGGLNLVTQYAYDGNDNRIAMTDPRGKLTQYAYDVQNRLSKVTDALSNLTQYAYDPVGNRIQEIDANGHTSCNQYDALNRLTVEIRKMGATSCALTAASDIVTRHFYDIGASMPCYPEGGAPVCGGPTPGSSHIAFTIDPENKYSYFKYDKVDRRWITIRKVGDTADSCDSNDWCEYVNYDPADNVLARRDANGNATTYTYYPNNWLKTESNALGETTEYTYDGVGNVITTRTPGGNLITNAYNPRNELIQADDRMGRVASYGYDGVGNRKLECDGNNNCSSYDYDAVNRLIAVTDAMGNTTRHAYDKAGNLLKTTDRMNNVTCYLYDAINRRTFTAQLVGGGTSCMVLDANDVWTKTHYDAVGNVTELTTAKHGSTPDACNGSSPPEDCETTRYVYDAVNRLVQEIYPKHDKPGDPPTKNSREFAYDKAGNLTQRIDQKNQATRYVYNDLYYLTLRDYPSDPDDRFAYDTGGRMLRAGRGGWLVTFDYDPANRVLKTTQNGKAVEYAYDIPNRCRTVKYPSGKTIIECRDFRERLDEINDAASPPIVKYAYDLGNRVQTRTYRNGVQAAYAYNPNNWIIKLEHKAGNTLIAGFGHGYDSEGNKRYEEKQHDPGHSEGYNYDDLYRLIHFKVGELDAAGAVPIPLTQTQYDLDKVGNWDKMIKDGAPQIREHNPVNELIAIDAAPLYYDANGNLIEDTQYLYGYDEENRLKSVTRKSDSRVVGQYQYDALSRRVKKVADPMVGFSKTTLYFYDGWRVLEERDAAGLTLATYVYGNYLKEVLTMDRGGQTFYYHQNALWSVEAITDSLGTPVERYAYDAYGQPTITDGAGNPVAPNMWGIPNIPHSAIENPRMFTGQEFDEESGLYYFGYRYYSPSLGRWLSRDPIGEEGGVSLYSFVENRPVQHIDWLGLKGCCKCLKVYVGIVKNPGLSGLYYNIMGIVSPSEVQFHFGVKHPFTIETTGGEGCKCKYHDVGRNTFNGKVYPLDQTHDIPCKSDTDYPGFQPVIKFVPGGGDVDVVIGIDLLHGITCTSSDGSTLSAIGQTTLSPTKFKILVRPNGIILGTPETL